VAEKENNQGEASRVEAQDWSPLTPLSGDPDALRYFIEIDMAMEPKR
jgi:hypothetical protein